MRFVFCLSFTSLTFGALAAQEARQPLLSLYHFGGEGGPVIAATRNVESFPVYTHPWPSSAQVGTVRLIKDKALEFDAPRTVIYRLGEAEVLPQTTAIKVEVVRLENEHILFQGVDTVQFIAGERLEILCYHAEGYYYFREDERTFSAFAEVMKIHREPETETWIHLAEGDESGGWIQVDGDLVRVLERRF